MKKISFLSAVAFFAISGVSAQYCTPPNFNSGPFTGILQVKMAGIDKTTLGTDGYSDYSSSENGTVARGETVPVSIKVEHTILNTGTFSDKVDLRIWIDWNQDMDFDDAGEEVTSQEIDVSIASGSTNNAVYDGNFVVPTDAKEGKTRMRVYEDMLARDGHQAPNPCGYSAGMGQHGESEDYSITVTSASSIESNLTANSTKIFPNPVSSNLNVQLTEDSEISLLNSLGQIVLFDQVKNNYELQLDISNLNGGIYYLNIKSESNSESHRIIVNH